MAAILDFESVQIAFGTIYIPCQVQWS